LNGDALRRCAIWALVALLPVAAAHADDAPESYAAIVAMYAKGDASDAIRALLALPTHELDTDVREFVASRAALHNEPVMRADMEAAAMLHAETGLALVVSNPDHTAPDTDRQFQLGRTYAQALHKMRGGEPFAERWTHLVASCYELTADLGKLRQWLDEAIRTYPRSALVLKDEGIAEEIAIAAWNGNPRGAAPPHEYQYVRHRDRPGSFERAEALYRHAAELAPGDVSARLRLAWATIALHRSEEAEEALAAARPLARSDDDRYLLHMLAGSVDAQRSDWAGAASEYKAATGALPGAQAAWIALSQAQLASGDRDAARASEETVLRRTPDRDPWWSFSLGEIDRSTLEWLRDEVRRP
jgi:hypothetical protein